MKFVWARFATLLAAFAMSAAAARTPSVRDTSHLAPDGSRVLEQSLEIAAPVRAVWNAFATTEGWRAWGAPVANVDLRVGGVIESSYDPAVALGSGATIRNRITAFVPERMLAFVNEQAPPRTAFDVPTFQRLQTIIFFEPVGATRTRVTVTQAGYGQDRNFDGVYRFFRWGNAQTLEQLRRHLERGARSPSARTPQARRGAIERAGVGSERR